jgi:hypothetical protein
MVQIPLAPHQTCHFIRSRFCYIIPDLQTNYNTPDKAELKEDTTQNQFLSPYTMFKYPIRSELTRKYYGRKYRACLKIVVPIFACVVRL